MFSVLLMSFFHLDDSWIHQTYCKLQAEEFQEHAIVLSNSCTQILFSIKLNTIFKYDEFFLFIHEA